MEITGPLGRIFQTRNTLGGNQEKSPQRWKFLKSQRIFKIKTYQVRRLSFNHFHYHYTQAPNIYLSAIIIATDKFRSHPVRLFQVSTLELKWGKLCQQQYSFFHAFWLAELRTQNQLDTCYYVTTQILNRFSQHHQNREECCHF